LSANDNAAEFDGDIVIGGNIIGDVGVTGSISVGGNIVNDDLSETFAVIRQALDGYGASDEQLKDFVMPINNAMDKLVQLNGVSFEWNATASNYANLNEGERNLGLIAQDVEEIIPEAIDNNGIYKHIKYNALTALLVEAVKELKSENEKLKERLNILESS
jgi:hypothetical protein